MAVPCHDARGEFTSTVLPLSRAFCSRARARILCPFNPRCASATLTADLELAQAPPPSSATCAPTWSCSPAPRSFPHKTNSSSWSSPRDALNARVSSTLNVAVIGACAECGRDLGLSGFRYGHCRSSSTRTQHKHITQSEISSTAHRTILIALALVQSPIGPRRH